jgi:hypothetical protein
MPSGLEERDLAGLSSNRWLAEALRWRGADTGTLRTLGLRRNDSYALNFYLHREIPSWTEKPVRDGFVLTNSRACADLRTKELCEDLFAWNDFPGSWQLFRITPNDSLDRPGSGREPRQEE